MMAQTADGAWSPEAALRGAETMHERRVVAQRREVFQAALRALAPTDPALYGDTDTIMRALAAALAAALARALYAQGDHDGALRSDQ